MSNVVPFPGADDAPQPTIEQARARAWSTHYAAEREAGASPALAHQRTTQFMDRHADSLIENIRKIMGQG